MIAPEQILILSATVVGAGVLLWIILRMEDSRVRSFVKLLERIDQTMKLVSTRYERHKHPRGFYRYHFRVEQDGQERLLSVGEETKNVILATLEDGDEFIMTRDGEYV